jgi:mono/diheme cytochrome c family protein
MDYCCVQKQILDLSRNVVSLPQVYKNEHPMDTTRRLFLLAALSLLAMGYCKDESIGAPDPEIPSGTSVLPTNLQPLNGNAAQGWAYLRTGDFIGGGIPLQIYRSFPTNLSDENLLQREGSNAKLPPGFNAYTTPSGVEVASGVTCFGCHSGKINGQFIPGLGNSLLDFTQNNSTLFNFLELGIRNRYGEQSAEWKAFEPYGRGSKVVLPYIVLPFKGINPAFALEQASVAHRRPADLNWNGGKTIYPIPTESIGSDVPPLWLAKKKYALYYNGMGRGDFSKLLMQVAVVAVEDTVNARRINNNFKDVVAWLQQLQAPPYPGTIDLALAAKGKTIYAKNCQACHGTYGAEESYPNLLVRLDKVGTDSAYANYFMENISFSNWYTQSWYGQSSPRSEARPSRGYVAPPLDGVWATAPYLHNGSVPNLEDLLNSPQRPKYWRRNFDDKDYDVQKVGWKYSIETSATDKQTYNTTLKGYGNGGHTYGDQLDAAERKALLEYLKQL